MNIRAVLSTLAIATAFQLASTSTWAQADTAPSSTSTLNTLIQTTQPTPHMPTNAAPPTAATADKAGAANPYGIQALWSQSDLVAKAVLLILLVMSAASWYVIALKLLEQRRMRLHGREALRNIESVASLSQAAQNWPAASPFRRVAHAGLEALTKHARLADKISLDDWLVQSTERAVDRVQRRLQTGMAVLATIGSTAPFVGLFGTVWGIYHALTAIGVAGQASIDKVAGPVGEALIMTAIGLAVAVPAVLGYNWLTRRNKTALDEVRDFGMDVHTTLLAGA